MIKPTVTEMPPFVCTPWSLVIMSSPRFTRITAKYGKMTEYPSRHHTLPSALCFGCSTQRSTDTFCLSPVPVYRFYIPYLLVNQSFSFKTAEKLKTRHLTLGRERYPTEFIRIQSTRLKRQTKSARVSSFLGYHRPLFKTANALTWSKETCKTSQKA